MCGAVFLYWYIGLVWRSTQKKNVFAKKCCVAHAKPVTIYYDALTKHLNWVPGVVEIKFLSFFQYLQLRMIVFKNALKTAS